MPILEKLRRIKERAEQLEKILTSCTLCPRECRVDRTSGEKGVCGAGKDIVVSSYGPHFGEEPELVGIHGSGTIFLTYCNLLCIYCQNYEISHLGASEFQSFPEVTVKRNSDAGLGGVRGKQSGCPRGVTGSDSDHQRGVSPYESNRYSDYLGIGDIISEEKLSDIMLKLQKNGCHNINLVTPTHFTPQIVKSLRYAIEKGLDIPVVWNCSGYENIDVIKLLDDIVDIYMPDIKYSDSEPAKKYSNAPDYFERCKEAIEEMYRQVGDLKINSSGIAEKGLLVRHLVLPDNLAGSEKVLKFIAGLSKNTYVNIMDQYRPCGKAYLYPEINRRPTEEEFKQVIKIARNLGLHRGFESI